MAETISLECPECGKVVAAPAAIAGKKVKCKGCGEVFVAPKAAPAAKPAAKAAAKPEPKPAAKPAPRTDDEDMGDGKPYGVVDEYLGARCPECANPMEDEAIICLACGFNTRTRQRVESRRVADVTPKDYFLWLLPGGLCLLACIILIVWNILFLVRADSWFEGESLEFLRHGSVKLYQAIISIFAIFLAGRFAIKRLILNPHPPEIELKK